MHATRRHTGRNSPTRAAQGEPITTPAATIAQEAATSDVEPDGTARTEATPEATIAPVTPVDPAALRADGLRLREVVDLLERHEATRSIRSIIAKELIHHAGDGGRELGAMTLRCNELRKSFVQNGWANLSAADVDLHEHLETCLRILVRIVVPPRHNPAWKLEPDHLRKLRACADAMVAAAEPPAKAAAQSGNHAGQNKPVVTQVDPSSTADVQECKGVVPRNAWFLTEYESLGTDTYHKPAKVWAKWDSMMPQARAGICPESSGKIAKSTVSSIIKRELAKRKAPTPRKPAKSKRARV